MKIAFYLCALLLSTSVCATGVINLSQFFIKINNNLDTDCVLQDQTILYGHISDHTEVPKTISARETAQFTMRSGPHYRAGIREDKTIILTYVCGPEQYITLYTTEHSLSNSKYFDEKNMNAELKIENFLFNPSEISWTLTY